MEQIACVGARLLFAGVGPEMIRDWARLQGDAGPDGKQRNQFFEVRLTERHMYATVHKFEGA